MNYGEAYEYLQRFTNYERIPGVDYTRGVQPLERTRLLLSLLGQPQAAFRSVVIAGTKGKGSVAAMLDAVLRVAGHKTGLYTSPHLHTMRERIRVNGTMIPPDALIRLVEKMTPVVARIQGLGEPGLVPTTYELITALAFLYFQEMAVEVAVLEVGLGGRLDAVNVTQPLVSVITSISLDHTQVLGDTIALIAKEKAGIIKPSGRVVSAPQPAEAMSVIQSVALNERAHLAVVGRDIYVATGHLPEVVSDDEGVPIYQAFSIRLEAPGAPAGSVLRVKLPLLGAHQQVNAAVAAGALLELDAAGVVIDRRDIIRGLAQVQWPGRLEVIHRSPLVVADGAHNVESISRLGEALDDLFHGQPVCVVLGLSADKDIPGIVGELRAWQQRSPSALIQRVIITRSNHPRAADPAQVAQHALEAGLAVEIRTEVPAALQRAEALAAEISEDGATPLIAVTGSLFVVAEAREHYGLAPDLSEEV